MKIDPIDSHYHTPQASFKGVTNKLSKAIYMHPEEELREYLLKRGDKNAIVGELPGFITRKLDKAHMSESIKEILNTFAQVANEIRDFKPATFHEWEIGRPQETVDKLKRVLSKYNILRKDDDFDLEYLGKGGKGKVFKISGLRDLDHFDEDDFVIKVFYTNDLGESYSHHGVYSEINAASYWMRNIGFDTNRGKFFFGDLNNGYMVNKFIDEDVRLPKRKVDFEKLGFYFTDENAGMGHNSIRGYFYDWGGCTLNKNFVNLKDPVLRRTRNYIMTIPANERLAEWLKKFNTVSKNKESEYTALAQCIPYLPKESQAPLVQKCLDLGIPRVKNMLESCGLLQSLNLFA